MKITIEFDEHEAIDTARTPRIKFDALVRDFDLDKVRISSVTVDGSIQHAAPSEARPFGFVRISAAEEGAALFEGDLLDCASGMCVVVASGVYKNAALVRVQTVSPKKSLPFVGATLTWKTPRAGCGMHSEFVGVEP